MTLVVDHDFCSRYNACKPAFPYSIGSKFLLQSHQPEFPLRINDGHFPFSKPARALRRDQHPVEGCRLNPSSSGVPVAQPCQIEVQVTDIVKVKDATSAQLVVIQILSISSANNSRPPLKIGSQCIAKYYDPLYNHYQDDVDPFLGADYFYQHEVAAYDRLVDLQGDGIPYFYGSYSTSIPTSFDETMLGEAIDVPTVIRHGACERAVRCILIEKIEGTVLRDLPHNVPEKTSQAIMRAIVDTESRIFKRDVRHRDLFSRNVIIRGLKHDRPKVTIIDFGHATVGYRGLPDGDEESEERRLPGVYISPLLRWNIAWFSGDTTPGDFKPWIRWDWQKWLDDTYEHELKLITPGMKQRYLPDRVLRDAGLQWRFASPRLSTEAARSNRTSENTVV